MRNCSRLGSVSYQVNITYTCNYVIKCSFKKEEKRRQKRDQIKRITLHITLALGTSNACKVQRRCFSLFLFLWVLVSLNQNGNVYKQKIVWERGGFFVVFCGYMNNFFISHEDRTKKVFRYRYNSKKMSTKTTK